MEYRIALIGLLGVVIGGLLTPWITSKMEDAKIKKSLRPQIIEIIYTFFNVRKAHITYSNIHNFKIQLTVFAIRGLHSHDKPNPKDAEILQKIIDSDDSKELAVHAEKYFDQLVEIEGKLIAFVCQAQLYYGQEVYNKLNKLIKPEIDKSNQPNNIYNYSKLEGSQLQKIAETIGDDLYTETQKLNPICDLVIGKVMTILK